MDLFVPQLMYELHTKDIHNPESVRRHTDRLVKDVKAAAGWDTDVQISIEPEVKRKGLFAISVSISGLRKTVAVRKVGRQLGGTLNKIKRILLRKIHRMASKRVDPRSRRAPRQRDARLD